jgi:hypothetical protein
LHGGERHGQRAVWLQRVSPHIVQLIACAYVNLLGVSGAFQREKWRTCRMGLIKAFFGSLNRFEGMDAGDIASCDDKRDECEYLQV